MKVYAINTGVLDYDINVAYTGYNLASPDNPNPDAVWYTAPTYAVLIDHPTEGWIMYDLGSRPDSMDVWPESLIEAAVCYYRPIEGATIEEQLATVGIKPEDVKHVVLSHMHMDHMGNVELFADTADFWVSKPEAEAAFTAVMQSADAESSGAYFKRDVLTPMKRLHYVEEDCELFPGIDAIILPGHTPGLMGLVLHLEDKPIILMSDGANSIETYSGNYAPPAGYSSKDWRASVAKVKKLQKELDADVWFGHDMDQFNSLKKVPEYYK